MEWRSNPEHHHRALPTRRQLLAGAGVAGALVIGFALWPRRYLPNLVAQPGELVLNGFLKIGHDGHVVVVIPQVELGQASNTILAQIVADELGADWQSVGVEPAPLNPLYANSLFADGAGWRGAFGFAALAPLQATEEGLALPGYASIMREAAAGARSLLCQAAARRWAVDAAACETAKGFVLHERKRLRFGDLAQEASRLPLPERVSLRQGASNRLTGSSLPRLDAPAKSGGIVPYAADIRLADMVFATIHQGPLGDNRLLGYSDAAARKVAGAVDVIALPDELVCVGETSWVAVKMLAAAAPRFTQKGAPASLGGLMKTLDAAVQAGGDRALNFGDAESALANGHAQSAVYHIGLMAHLAPEPMAATARLSKGQLEIWTSAQFPDLARDLAARASGLSPSKVILHSVMGGGSFGRRFELEIVAQVAALAVKLKRPVQLFWSRAEDMMHDRFGGGYAAQMSAQVLPDGRVNAWHSIIAAPPVMDELKRRVIDGETANAAMRAASGAATPSLIGDAQPPYALANLAIDLCPVSIDVPTGPMRGGTAFATCFFNESFINELSAKTGVEPFSFRMALAGGNTRLGQCLAKVTALAGWNGGGQGGNQGLACFASDNAFIAVVAEAKMGESGQVQVSKLTAVADLGQLINPDIARQQIEGGLLFGLSLAVAAPVVVTRGIPGPTRLGDFHLPVLADAPELVVELLVSNAAPASAWDIGVPPVAPAIAGALFAGSGKRYRTLPFSMEQAR